MGMYVLWDPCIIVHCAKSLQSCLTLCNPMDCSPPGSSVHGILQAKILECVAIPSSRGPSRPRDQTRISYVPCTGGQSRHHWCHLGSRSCIIMGPQNCNETVLIVPFFSCGHSWKQQALLLSHCFSSPWRSLTTWTQGVHKGTRVFCFFLGSFAS